MLPPMELNGTSAIVSGGASGLGEATVRELAAAGATVVVADLNDERGKAIAGEIGGVFAQTDVSDEDSVAAGGRGRRGDRRAAAGRGELRGHRLGARGPSAGTARRTTWPPTARSSTSTSSARST